MNIVAGIFGFLQFTPADLLDILMVALIIFLLFRLIKDSAAVNIFAALILLLVIQVVVDALNMKMMSALMNTLLDVGILAILIIFQPEIRHFLTGFGSRTGVGRKGVEFFSRIFGIKDEKMGSASVQEIAEACRAMSASKTGALIVIPHSTPLQYIIETGDRIDAVINRRLIMNLFFKNSPLHDGAMIISGNRIVAARCTLPITGRTDIPASYGMRHKAAIGISEETDASVIVVSEETGQISFVKGGELKVIGNMNELKLELGEELSAKAQDKNEGTQRQQ